MDQLNLRLYWDLGLDLRDALMIALTIRPGKPHLLRWALHPYSDQGFMRLLCLHVSGLGANTHCLGILCLTLLIQTSRSIAGSVCAYRGSEIKFVSNL